MLAVAAAPPPQSTLRFNIGFDHHMIILKEELRTVQQKAKGWDLVGKNGKPTTNATEDFVNNGGFPDVRPSKARPQSQPAQRPPSAWTQELGPRTTVPSTD